MSKRKRRTGFAGGHDESDPLGLESWVTTTLAWSSRMAPLRAGVGLGRSERDVVKFPDARRNVAKHTQNNPGRGKRREEEGGGRREEESKVEERMAIWRSLYNGAEKSKCVYLLFF